MQPIAVRIYTYTFGSSQQNNHLLGKICLALVPAAVVYVWELSTEQIVVENGSLALKTGACRVRARGLAQFDQKPAV